jgi:Leucine Rich repeat
MQSFASPLFIHLSGTVLMNPFQRRAPGRCNLRPIIPVVLFCLHIASCSRDASSELPILAASAAAKAKTFNSKPQYRQLSQSGSFRFSDTGDAIAYTCQGVGLADSQLAELRNVESLRSLTLTDRSISDETMNLIASLRTLTVLALSGTTLGPRGLLSLASLGQLEELDLSGTRAVGDFGIKGLAGLPHLRILILSRAALTDGEAESLFQLQTLRTLNIDGSTLKPATLTGLANLTSLESLSLAQTQVDDGVLASLCTLPTLSYLNLATTPIGDASVTDLCQMNKLTTLILRQTRITESGLARIHSKVPQCLISH